MFVLCVEKAFPGKDAIFLAFQSVACLIEVSCDVVIDTQVKYVVFQNWEQSPLSVLPRVMQLTSAHLFSEQACFSL